MNKTANLDDHIKLCNATNNRYSIARPYGYTFKYSKRSSRQLKHIGSMQRRFKNKTAEY